MLVLGIESTCDETACSVVKDGNIILSNIILSQIDVHKEFGGVVPSIAMREHCKHMLSVCKLALTDAKVDIQDIDCIAVAHGPGLTNCISIGMSIAEAIAMALSKPLVYVNHIHAHIYAALMLNSIATFPVLGCVISGAHSSFFIINSYLDFELIGETIDDAVGEAFDKVASMLDLGYPGGPIVEKKAHLGNRRFKFKTCKSKLGKLYFSNSGLKTQIMYKLREFDKPFSDSLVNDICRSFQDTVFEDIVYKTKYAIEATGINKVAFGGGVINNNTLRRILLDNINGELFFPPNKLSVDNAAMIAGLGYHRYMNKKFDKEMPTARFR